MNMTFDNNPDMERKAKERIMMDRLNNRSLFGVIGLRMKGMMPKPIIGIDAVWTPKDMMARSQLYFWL